jgi:hypothetical protein
MALEDMAATPPLDEGGDVECRRGGSSSRSTAMEAVQGAVEAAGGPPGSAELLKAVTPSQTPWARRAHWTATLDEDVGCDGRTRHGMRRSSLVMMTSRRASHRGR